MIEAYVKPILVLAFICLMVSGALAYAYTVTEPVISEAAAERAYTARKEIIPHAEEFIALETDGLPKNITEAYATSNNVGYIFMMTTSGYGGEFHMICGITPDGELIKSAVLDHQETQGLGTIVFVRATVYEGLDAVAAATVDSIAGSTITSNAYRRGLLEAFEAFELVKGDW